MKDLPNTEEPCSDDDDDEGGSSKYDIQAIMSDENAVVALQCKCKSIQKAVRVFSANSDACVLGIKDDVVKIASAAFEDCSTLVKELEARTTGAAKDALDKSVVDTVSILGENDWTKGYKSTKDTWAPFAAYAKKTITTRKELATLNKDVKKVEEVFLIMCGGASSH